MTFSESEILGQWTNTTLTKGPKIIDWRKWDESKNWYPLEENYFVCFVRAAAHFTVASVNWICAQFMCMLCILHYLLIAPLAAEHPISKSQLAHSAKEGWKTTPTQSQLQRESISPALGRSRSLSMFSLCNQLSLFGRCIMQIECKHANLSFFFKMGMYCHALRKKESLTRETGVAKATYFQGVAALIFSMLCSTLILLTFYAYFCCRPHCLLQTHISLNQKFN